MSLITSLSWIPKGAARKHPVRFELSPHEYLRIKRKAKEEEEGAATEAEGGNGAIGASMADLPAELRMDEYDDEDDEPTLCENNDELDEEEYDDFAQMESGEAAFANDEEEDEDEEDNMILETDSLIVVARTEDDDSHLEIQLLTAAGDLYVHHDITLPELPLCLAWLDIPPFQAGTGGQLAIGNYIAVGTFDPAIEIWNLDVLDPLEPSATLGGVNKRSAPGKTGKGKKRDSRPKLVDGSHTDAVLGLSWNRSYRQALASCSADKTVKVWDVTTQACSHTFSYHSDKVQSVQWHPAEAYLLASGSFDKTVCLVDCRSASAEPMRYSLESDVEAMQWDPFSAYHLYCALEDGEVVCIDRRKEGAPLYVFKAHEETTTSLSFSCGVPGMMATSSLDQAVRVWDVLDTTEPKLVAYKSMNVGRLFTLQYYSDDSFALAAAGEQGVVAVWESDEQEILLNHFSSRARPIKSLYSFNTEKVSEGDSGIPAMQEDEDDSWMNDDAPVDDKKDKKERSAKKKDKKKSKLPDVFKAVQRQDQAAMSGHGSKKGLKASKSVTNLHEDKQPEEAPKEEEEMSTVGIGLLAKAQLADAKVLQILQKSHQLYNAGHYNEALQCCEIAYEADAYRTDNLLLMGAIHFQLRNFSESIFYNQQCIRVDPNFAEGYSNLGNALKELGDIKASTQFYLKAIKLKPRYCDAYNNLACAYMQLGQSQEAMETYQMALVLNPGLVDAHSNLGNLYKATGDLEAAKKCYLEAIRIKPEFAIAWSNLAGVLKEEGQLAASIAYYREAIRLCPEFADAHSNLGNALKEQMLLDDAMASYQTAVKLRPDFAIGHGNLGSCYYETGDISAAIKSFKYAIQLEPNFPDAHNNLGNAFREGARLDEAIQCYRAALRLKPDHPHAYNNLGNAMKDKGFVKEAIHCYVTAIRLLPTFAAAHSNLGCILKDQLKFDQAISHFQEAVIIDPFFADAYSNMGNAYKDMGQVEDAIKCYFTAVKIKPTYADALSNLAAACKDSGRVAKAIEYYKQSLQLNPNSADAMANLAHSMALVCDWSTREDDLARLSQLIRMQMAKGLSNFSATPSIQPLHALAFPLSLSEMLQIASSFACKTKFNIALADQRFVFRPKPKSLRLKIGYVSSDLGNHPLSQSMQSVFGLHDKSRFEVVCYALSGSDKSAERRKIEAEAEVFKDISLLHPSDAAQLIANDGIHVLVNLNGYTKGSKNEIFAMKPAPVQVSLLGHCGTMAADYIPYMIADSSVVPEELRPYYSEKIVSMPHSFLVNDHRQSCRGVVDMLDMPTRAQYGLKEDSFVFCNFSQLYKIDPTVFDVWMSILKRVPNSVLWLLRFPPAGEQHLLQEAYKRGVRGEDQIVFSDVLPRPEHIKRGYLADLFLDTTLCNAHTTACDVLWSGTPLLTLPDQKMSARVGCSLLRAIGLESELVCDSLLRYEEAAVALAQDSEKLFGMRRHIERCRDSCALFDTKRWTGNLEKAFAALWRDHEAGVLEHIDIDDAEPVLGSAPEINLMS